MSVLDPFEVAEIEMCPFWELDSDQAKETLDRFVFLSCPWNCERVASIPIFGWRGARGQSPIWQGLSVSARLHQALDAHFGRKHDGSNISRRPDCEILSNKTISDWLS